MKSIDFSAQMLVEHEHSAANYKTIYLEGEKKVFMCKQCPNEFFDDIEFKVGIENGQFCSSQNISTEIIFFGTQQHIISHKQDEMIKFKCGKCGLQLKDSITFAEHRELHEHLPENHCPICKRDMKSNKNLRSHVKSCNVSHLN